MPAQLPPDLGTLPGPGAPRLQETQVAKGEPSTLMSSVPRHPEHLRSRHRRRHNQGPKDAASRQRLTRGPSGAPGSPNPQLPQQGAEAGPPGAPKAEARGGGRGRQVGRVKA